MSTKPSVKPSIHHNIDYQRCVFSIDFNFTPVKRSHIFVNIPASDVPLSSDFLSSFRFRGRRYERGWVVVKHDKDRHWYLIDVVAIQIPFTGGIEVSIVAVDEFIACDTIAVGIDQRLRREDIDGATIIKKNKSGTKWIFQHAEVEEHHDRMLLAETAMATLFDELTYSRLSRVLTVMVQGKPKNQQLGELTVMEHINSFKHDCMRMARWHEGELDIGDHMKDPEEHYIYNMLQKAFATAEKKWQVEKSAELNQISDHIAPIKKRLASRHSFKFRWERPTVFPDASRTPQSTSRTPQPEGE